MRISIETIPIDSIKLRGEHLIWKSEVEKRASLLEKEGQAHPITVYLHRGEYLTFVHDRDAALLIKAARSINWNQILVTLHRGR